MGQSVSVGQEDLIKVFDNLQSYLNSLNVHSHNAAYSNRIFKSYNDNNSDSDASGGCSQGSLNKNAEYGWFEDFESPYIEYYSQSNEPLRRAISLPAPMSDAPMYILESSLKTQELWYETAGRRPKQPQHEREYFERLYLKNFENSGATYNTIPSSARNKENIDSNYNENYENSHESCNSKSKAEFIQLILSKQQSECDKLSKSEVGGEIVYQGKGPFSNTVSKSFDHEVASIILHVPSYRIIKASDGSTYAEFHIVISLHSLHKITFGIWRRHSDFSMLARKLQASFNEEKGVSTYKNAILSWQCLLNRKRWFKCLDIDYLSLKCFLLERFMHDVVFESPTPELLSEFLGLV